jgi:hypothetical protein
LERIRVFTAVLLAVSALLVAVFTVIAFSDTTTPATCPTGMLRIDINGTYICAVSVPSYTPSYVSLMVSQVNGTFTLNLTCLYEAGCNVNVTVYDYVNGSAVPLGSVQSSLPPGETGSWSFSVNGSGVALVYVNGDYLGAFAAPVGVSVGAGVLLKSLASSSPFIMIVTGLLVVSVPLGWMLQKEWGTAGLALLASSYLIYMFTYALTDDILVSSLVSVFSGLAGLFYLLVSGGSV